MSFRKEKAGYLENFENCKGARNLRKGKKSLAICSSPSSAGRYVCL